jgi:hypothetical protein
VRSLCSCCNENKHTVPWKMVYTVDGITETRWLLLCAGCSPKLVQLCQRQGIRLT